FILLALTLGWSANAWADVTMPAGTYYFDFSQCTGDKKAWQINVFNGYNDGDLSYSSDHACNVNVEKSHMRSYYNDNGLSTLVISTNSQQTKGGGFIQCRIGATKDGASWIPQNWSEYTAPTNVGTNDAKIFVCQIHNDGTYSWATSSSAIPSCDTPTPPTPSGPCANCKKITK
ncbi:MAG: hypothetical protein KBT06_11660, partial [Prevotellaceae bacterium]|nr:hypothetical protein [Candidatus Colivivens equi]